MHDRLTLPNLGSECLQVNVRNALANSGAGCIMIGFGPGALMPQRIFRMASAKHTGTLLSVKQSGSYATPEQI